jgi:5'-phosphate synthase pdxT subunit
MFETLGIKAQRVRNPQDIEGLAGLVIPGGESTAIANLLRIHGMYEPLLEAHTNGMAFFGTCAGAILLAREAKGKRDDQRLLGLLDASIDRNAYGRQVDSFEATIPFKGVKSSEVRGVFIRAPRFKRLGAAVEVLSATPQGEPLAVRQGAVLAVTFHPELTTDNRVHRYFLEHCVSPSRG